MPAFFVTYKEVKWMLRTDAEDFVRGRTFGIHGNVRKAIVVKRDGAEIWWAWTSSVDDIGCNPVGDIVAKCVWFGPIDYVLLKIVEENGCVPDSKSRTSC